MQILGIVSPHDNIRAVVPDHGLTKTHGRAAEPEDRANDLLPREDLGKSGWLDSYSVQLHLREINKDPMLEIVPTSYHYKNGLHRTRVILLDRGIHLDHPVSLFL